MNNRHHPPRWYLGYQLLRCRSFNCVYLTHLLVPLSAPWQARMNSPAYGCVCFTLHRTCEGHCHRKLISLYEDRLLGLGVAPFCFSYRQKLTCTKRMFGPVWTNQGTHTLTLVRRISWTSSSLWGHRAMRRGSSVVNTLLDHSAKQEWNKCVYMGSYRRLSFQLWPCRQGEGDSASSALAALCQTCTGECWNGRKRHGTLEGKWILPLKAEAGLSAQAQSPSQSRLKTQRNKRTKTEQMCICHLLRFCDCGRVCSYPLGICKKFHHKIICASNFLKTTFPLAMLVPR